MENEPTKAVDDFLAGLSNDGSKDPLEENQADPFKPTETEQKETTEEVGTVEKPDEVVEKPLPYHKDPKVQRFIEKEVAKALADRPEPQAQRDSSEPDRIDEVLTRIIGNDTPEKISAMKDLKDILLEPQREIQELRQEKEAEAQQEAEAENTLLTGFESIEEETGVDLFAPENKKLKGQFIEFIRKVAPKDDDGEITDFPDFMGTFESFQAIRKESSSTSRAKELASRSNERGGGSIDSKPKERQSFDSNEWEKFKESL